jgi:hypothetical protein
MAGGFQMARDQLVLVEPLEVFGGLLHAEGLHHDAISPAIFERIPFRKI